MVKIESGRVIVISAINTLPAAQFQEAQLAIPRLLSAIGFVDFEYRIATSLSVVRGVVTRLTKAVCLMRAVGVTSSRYHACIKGLSTNLEYSSIVFKVN